VMLDMYADAKYNDLSRLWQLPGVVPIYILPPESEDIWKGSLESRSLARSTYHQLFVPIKCTTSMTLTSTSSS
jgi:hypothetical protein